MRRIAPLLLACLALMGCAAQSEAPEPAREAQRQEQERQAEPRQGGVRLIGMVAEDDGGTAAYMMMHGFLSTAENLGYPAKLYRITTTAEDSVAQAVSDGCLGLLIPAEHSGAIARAAEAGLYVVAPYEECSLPGVDVNVVADQEVYIEELARGIAERMTERNLRSGRILVYGRDTAGCYAEFASAVQEYYPQFSTVEFTRAPGSGEEAAIEELAQFILNNRDVKGMYACDPASAPIAVAARSRAISMFREMAGASPTPSPAPAPQSGPTPNPGLLTQISITAFGCGISDENLALFNDNDIYALCIEPYYEAAATATMMLDRLLMGEETAATVTVSRPIAYADTIDKYLAIYNEVKELFKLN